MEGPINFSFQVKLDYILGQIIKLLIIDQIDNTSTSGYFLQHFFKLYFFQHYDTLNSNYSIFCLMENIACKY